MTKMRPLFKILVRATDAEQCTQLSSDGIPPAVATRPKCGMIGAFHAFSAFPGGG